MIGELKEPVTLLRPVYTSDGGGGFSRSFDEVETVFGRIQGIRSGTENVAGTTAVRAQFDVDIRGRDDVDATYRLRWDSREYRITRLRRNPQRSERLTLTVSEVGQ